MIVLSFYTIYAIFKVTYEVNSQPNPPPGVIIYTIPYLNIPVGTGEGWNLVAVFMCVGGVLAGIGIPSYNIRTQRYA